MTATYTQILQTIADYIVERVNDDSVGGFGYAGILPPIDSKTEYRNLPPGFFPLLGVSTPLISYVDQSIGQLYPAIDVHILFSNRTSGTNPEEIMPEMLDYIMQMENICIQASRDTLFGLPNTLAAINLIDCPLYPTFYTEVDGDRKAFTIAVMSLRIHLGGR